MLELHLISYTLQTSRVQFDDFAEAICHENKRLESQCSEKSWKKLTHVEDPNEGSHISMFEVLWQKVFGEIAGVLHDKTRSSLERKLIFRLRNWEIKKGKGKRGKEGVIDRIPSNESVSVGVVDEVPQFGFKRKVIQVLQRYCQRKNFRFSEKKPPCRRRKVASALLLQKRDTLVFGMFFLGKNEPKNIGMSFFAVAPAILNSFPSPLEQ
jgi:hypothetical protein